MDARLSCVWSSRNQNSEDFAFKCDFFDETTSKNAAVLISTKEFIEETTRTIRTYDVLTTKPKFSIDRFLKKKYCAPALQSLAEFFGFCPGPLTRIQP
jgi:hypothetical protein